ncbi:membrane protein insertase YidC [Helicobacter enhydrae]|uniref:Membrane protein insertase YidC n=1 Tax=Helicobacter enhydrae TaxID=222136 RepID=A0A1B1U4K3_9HELI|nr:membrane protein insertase YidC [Helicobacter enhydrae]ANV97625.1 membrane protein insertase YidC [Helicobacter enhydrae]
MKHIPPPYEDQSFSMTRMLVALVVTIGALSLYTYFFPQQPIQPKENVAQVATHNAPSTASKVTQASTSPQNDLLLVVKAKDFDIEFDTLGRIKQVFLKNKKFITPKQESLLAKLFGVQDKQEELKALPLLQEDGIRPLEVRFADVTLNQKAFEVRYSTAQKEIILDDQPVSFVLEQKIGEVVLRKHLTIKPNMSFEITTSLEGSNSVYFLTNGSRPIADSDQYAFLGTIVQKEGGSLEKLADGDLANEEMTLKHAVFASSVDRYFTTLLYSKEGFEVIVDGKIASSSPIAFVRIQDTANIGGYIGPKNYDALKAIYKPLGDVVEYGMITFFAKPLFSLLELLYGVCGNWGWAIVLLTIIVRLVLFPLSYKGMMGMQKLKEIAPQMKELQTKYKDDPQKLQAQMMALYRKNGANPLGGCLPLLLQIPVFFAIYKVLYCAVELKSAPWIGWIHDLSAIDPYYVLPVFMGVTMYISQIMTPTTFTDPMQEKVFKLLPVFFMFFFIIFPFPAGLVLYWSVNNILSIIQQMIINRIVEKQKSGKVK